jgi:hypothetical protein
MGTGVVDRVIEHLPSKHKALSSYSNASPHPKIYVYKFFFDTESWNQVLVLVRQALYNSTSCFCVAYFWDGVLLYVQAGLELDAPICASPHSWDDKCISLCSTIGWDGFLWAFRPGWPGTLSLLMSALLIARMIILSYRAWPWFFFCFF